MSEFRLVLPEPQTFEPADYVKNQLVPVCEQLHKLCAEFFNPGCTAEENIVDMTPQDPHKYFEDIDHRINDKPKSCRFHVDHNTPLVKGDKRLKILLTAVCYVQPEGTACFRLIRVSDKMPVEDSIIQTNAKEPTLFNRYISFGGENGRINAFSDDYVIQAKYLGSKCWPVCRRFSLSAVYV